MTSLVSKERIGPVSPNNEITPSSLSRSDFLLKKRTKKTERQTMIKSYHMVLLSPKAQSNIIFDIKISVSIKVNPLTVFPQRLILE